MHAENFIGSSMQVNGQLTASFLVQPVYILCHDGAAGPHGFQQGNLIMRSIGTARAA
jgi:hypothetical protein